MNLLILSAGALTAIRFAGIAFQAFNTLFIARTLGLHEVGAFALIMAYLNIIRFTGAAGGDQLILRKISVYEDKALGSAQEIVDVSMLLSCLVPFVYLAGFVCYLEYAGIDFNYTQIMLTLAISVFYSNSAVFIPLLRSKGSLILSQIADALCLNAMLCVALLGGWLMNLLTLEYILIALLVICSLNQIWYLYRIKKTHLEIRVTFRVNGIRKYVDDLLGVYAAQLVTIVSARLPILLAGATFGASGAAIMDVAYRFGSLSSIITNSVGATFSPHFAKQLQFEQHPGAIRRSLLAGSASASVPAFIWVLLCQFFIDDLYQGLLPSTFDIATLPTILVALAFFLNATFGISTNLLFMCRKQYSVLVFSVAQIVVLVFIANFWSYIGIVSIPVAMIVGTVVRDGFSYAIALSYIRRR